MSDWGLIQDVEIINLEVSGKLREEINFLNYQ